MTEPFEHTADLPFSSFVDGDAVVKWRHFNFFDDSRGGHTVLQPDAPLQPVLFVSPQLGPYAYEVLLCLLEFGMGTPVGEVAIIGVQFVLLCYGWILTERMGDESTISLPWVRVAWVNSVMPVTGALMLLVSLARLPGMFWPGPHRQEGHREWSG